MNVDDDEEEAEAFMDGAEEDLLEVTKSAFDARYLWIGMDAEPSC